jgi:hypothetical protein
MTQIAARADMRPLLEARTVRLRLRRTFELCEPLRPTVREHVYARGAHGAPPGKQCARYLASSSGGALPAEATSGGENRSGRPGHSLKPMKHADQFAMCTQWSM